MRIVSLDARDFRSLQSVRWEPGVLNVLIGPNGSGKTNLVLLLKLMTQSARGKLAESIIRLGGITPLLWDRKADGFAFELRTTPDEANAKLKAVELLYKCKIVPKGRERFYEVNIEQLRRVAANDGKTRSATEFDFLVRRGPFAQVIKRQGSWLTPKSGTIATEESLLSAYGSQIGAYTTLSSFHGYLSSWSVFEPIAFDPDASVREPAVARHETRVEPSGSNLINVLHTLYTGDRQFKKDLNAAMKAAFGDEFEELNFPPAADQRVQLRVRWKSLRTEIPAADLSAGTLQFLFLITVLMAPSPPPLIVIEEPEQYLHPSMLAIVAEHAVDAALRTQVVFTTHSPQFLDSFGDTRPTTTVLECREGKTHLTTLSDERLEYWLEEYSLGKLFTAGILENEL